MADLAHDASGPASSEPAGIAQQQANRPSSSDDRGKLHVFISYSRDDLKFADQLDMALNACGFECLIDREGISGGEDWKRRLGNLISEADTVVFVLSPSSARSPICDWEVEEAARLNKRILPVNCRPLEGASPPPRLRELNYIFFYEEPKVPGSGFGNGLASLITALNTDFDWLRDHTRYLQRAIEWDKGGRPANRLLSGDDIAEAKAWVARRPKGAPEPTALQLDFIRASEEEAEARLSEQRKQLEAVAAAQAARETALNDRQEALKQAADAQREAADALRRRARIRNLAFVAVSVLAAVAVGFSWRAKKNGEEANELLSRGTHIITRSFRQMDVETKQEALALLQAGASYGNAYAMNDLGFFYANGIGVEKNYAKAREWYEKAAAKGETAAMSNLGNLYAHGLGGARDYGKAREWYEKAAATGEPISMVGLGFFYQSGLSVAQDFDKAREWIEKAATKGYADAMYRLGLLYQDGQGVAQDFDKAREWIEKAAAQGHEDAKMALEELPIREAETAGQYDEALRLREALATKMEAVEIKDDGKPGNMTGMELNNVILDALFAREFTKALTVADRSHALFPNWLEIEMNRAHALMFNGRDEEAKALYLAHKGQRMSDEDNRFDNRLWEGVIGQDFAEFRKAGLTHPMMADVEKELGISR
jgi:TPR repeat protein